jgi:hypothetical protein
MSGRGDVQVAGGRTVLAGGRDLGAQVGVEDGTGLSEVDNRMVGWGAGTLPTMLTGDLIGPTP